MTPKERADRLYQKMTVDMMIDKWQTKQCALAAIDMITDEIAFQNVGYNAIARMDYWKEVRNEIEKL